MLLISLHLPRHLSSGFAGAVGRHDGGGEDAAPDDDFRT
jgi:hypothetical protein